MKQFEPITDIFVGWGDILSGKPTWRDRFLPGTRGVLMASVAYLLVFILVLAVQSALVGRLPAPVEILANLLLASIRVLAIWIAILITKLVLRFAAPATDLLVPAIYALAALLALQLVLALLSPQVAQVLYGAIGYMLYRLGRTVAGLSLASSLAFGVLSIVLLVGMPIALYMLLQSGSGPI